MSFRNLLDLRKKTQQQTQIIERVVFQKRSLRSDFFLILSVIIVASGIIWGISKADEELGSVENVTPVEVVTEAPAQEPEPAPEVTPEPTPTEETNTQTNLPEEDLNGQAGTSIDTTTNSTDTNTETETDTQTDVTEITTPTEVATDTQTNLLEEDLTEQATDTQATTSNDSSSGGFFGGLIDTALDVIDSVVDVASTTVNTITDLLTGTSTPAVIAPEELIDTATSTIIFTEEETNLGKLVTVSAPFEDPNSPIVDVLASTTIPEIYRVGEEDKIQIKWTNNGDQQMTFLAVDTDNNNYLDYVEWTIPHLSTQIFEIIFISKAFHLDTDQTILADIYDTVRTQDNTYASLSNNQYIRVTFEQILDNTKDNTVYARATDINNPASIEIYPVYVDENGNYIQGSHIETIENITELATYKTFLTNLNTPTDIFDLKIVGSVDIDFIVDPPVGWTGTGTELDPYLVNSCGEADASGYYTLDADISSSSGACITISANDVTFIGTSPYSISNTGFSSGDDVAIKVNSGVTGVVIQDIEINNSGWYGANNEGTIVSISGNINNTGAGTGIINNGSGVIEDIDVTITDSGGGAAVYNYGTITINTALTGNDLFVEGGSINGSGIFSGSITLYGTTLDLSSGLTIQGTLTNNGGTITPAQDPGACTGEKVLGSIYDGSSIYAMCEVPLTTTIDRCGVITSSGTYTLNTDLSTAGGNCITISADNVTLDGASTYSITNNGADSAIYVSQGYSGINIENITVTNTNSVGIRNNGSTISNISGTINNSGVYGVYNDNSGIISNMSGTVNHSTGSGYYGVYNTNSSTLSNFSGTLYNSNSGWGIYAENAAIISDVSGAVENSSDGYGIYNWSGEITDISGTVSNTGVGYGIKNNATITNISGTVTETGGGSGVYNDSGGTITTISGTINNESTGVGIILYDGSSISSIADTAVFTNTGGGYGIQYNNSGSNTNSAYLGYIIFAQGAEIDINGNAITKDSIWNLTSLTDSLGGGSLEITAWGLDVANTITNVPLIVSGADVTIDADIDFSLPFNATYNYAIKVNSGATLTDYVGTMNKTGYYGIYNEGSITSISGTINSSSDNAGNSGVAAIYNALGASIETIGGTINHLSIDGHGIENYGSIITISSTINNSGDKGINNGAGGSIGAISGSVTNSGLGYGIYNSGTISYISGNITNTDGGGTGIGIIAGSSIGEIFYTAVFANASRDGIIFLGGGSIGPILGTGVDINLYGTNITQGGEWNLNSLIDPDDGNGSLDLYYNLTVTNTITDIPLVVSGANVTINADIEHSLTSPSHAIRVNTGATLTDYVGTLTNSGSGNGIYNEAGTITYTQGTIYNTGSGYGIYNDASITAIDGLHINSGSGISIYNGVNGTISDLYQTKIISKAGYSVYNEGTLTALTGSIYNFAGSTYYGLDATTFYVYPINIPVADGYIWKNTIGDYDWYNPSNWLEGVVPATTTDNIILVADMVLSENISNPVYFATGGPWTLYGGGLYTVDNSIYGIDGIDAIGNNSVTGGTYIKLDNVGFTGDVEGGNGGAPDGYAGAIYITDDDLDLSDKAINPGISDNSNNYGLVYLNYDSLTTNPNTIISEAGELIINGLNYYDTSGISAECSNGTSAGQTGCAWNGVFNPILFYYNNAAGDGDWNNPANWWNTYDSETETFSDQATYLPSGLNQVFLYGEVTQNLGDPALAKTIVFNATSTSAIDITVTDNVIFNDESGNSGTITLSGTATFNDSSSNTGTISAATSTFWEDTTSTVGGTIVGFLQRIFTSNATTTRDFTAEGGRDDWLVETRGAIVSLWNGVTGAVYDTASNVFRALLGGYFISNPGRNGGANVTPVITVDLGLEGTGSQIIKWNPVIDWDTSVTCLYSYDGFTSTTTANCNLDGSDIPRPNAGVSKTLSLRGVDSNGYISEKPVTYTYLNTVAIPTSCGADLLDEPRTYYYLEGNVTGPCTITATSTTTTLKGNLVSTSTGYTVTGNIVGNGNHINLSNITVTGTIDSDDGNIILSSGTFEGGIDSDGGNITITSSTASGAIESNGGTITTTGSTLEDAINSYGGAISFSTTIASATTTSQGGTVTIANSTTTDVVSTATTSGATAGAVTITRSTIGAITANGVSGTNGGNGAEITIATSTTGVLSSNGANGTADGGDAGNITVTNSIGVNASSTPIYANGGSSTSCGNGGDAGIVTLTTSTYGTISTTGGNAATSGCPGQTKTSGTTRTPTVTGEHSSQVSSPTSQSTPSANTTNSNSGARSPSFIPNTINTITLPVNTLKPVVFTPLPTFGTDTKGSFSFLTALSNFINAPFPQSLTDSLSVSPNLLEYLKTINLGTQQELLNIQRNPITLPLNSKDIPGIWEAYAKGLPTKSATNAFTLNSKLPITSKLTGKGSDLIIQTLKVTPGTSFTLSLLPTLNPQVDGQANNTNTKGNFLGKEILFTQNDNRLTISITAPRKTGIYTLTSKASPIPLAIEVVGQILPGQPNITPNITNDTNKPSLWSRIKSFFFR